MSERGGAEAARGDSGSGEASEAAKRFAKQMEQVRGEVGRVIVGQQRVVELVLTALCCGGHVLLEGVPGLGKTELVKALGRTLDLTFQRIQFTPDLMPADVIGTHVLEEDESGRNRIVFREGPVFTQLLLADEINRATPKTQSALLETMQERTVTAGGATRELPGPFLVLATQNPIEQEGTYPLPEAQLDRFMFKISVHRLERADLNEVLQRTVLAESAAPQQVLSADGVRKLGKAAAQVVVAEPMRDYATRLTLATHPDTEEAPEQVQRYVAWGASPRAAQALLQAARVRALAAGRPHAAFEDVRAYAHEVLQHRVLRNYDGQAEEVPVADLIESVVSRVPEEGQRHKGT